MAFIVWRRSRRLARRRAGKPTCSAVCRYRSHAAVARRIMASSSLRRGDPESVSTMTTVLPQRSLRSGDPRSRRANSRVVLPACSISPGPCRPRAVAAPGLRSAPPAAQLGSAQGGRHPNLPLPGPCRCHGREKRSTWAERQVCEIRLRAERRAGELLAAAEKNEGGRPAETSRSVRPVYAPRLSDLGISKTQSSRWQQLAAVPGARFEVAWRWYCHDVRWTTEAFQP